MTLLREHRTLLGACLRYFDAETRLNHERAEARATAEAYSEYQFARATLLLTIEIARDAQFERAARAHTIRQERA